MKAILFAIATLALGSLSACSKPNDVPVLEDQAHAIVKCGDAKVAAFDKRTAAIIRELGGRPVPPDVTRAMSEAHDAVVALRQRDAEVTNTTANLVKDGRADELQKYVHETEELQEQKASIAEDDLTAIEGWIARSAHVAAEPPPPPAPAPEAAPAPTDTPARP